MSFELNKGKIAVNNSKAKAIVVDSNDKALSVTMSESWIYAGYNENGLQDIYSKADNAFNNIDSLLAESITGTALKSGNADDIISMSNNSAILGDIDLGGGKNSITIENGSIIYGDFIGSAGTLTINMIIKNNNFFGPMISIQNQATENILSVMTNQTLNVTMNTGVAEQKFALITGCSDLLLQSYTVTLTADNKIYSLSYENYTQNGYSLIYSDNTLSLLYEDIIPPDAPKVSANITAVTNQNVILFAEFATDSILNEFKINDGNWQTYKTTGVVVSANCIVYFIQKCGTPEYLKHISTL